MKKLQLIILKKRQRTKTNQLKCFYLKLILPFIGFFISSFVMGQSASIYPSLTNNYCSGVFNSKIFVFSVSGVSTGDIELRNATNLIINSQGPLNSTQYEGIFWFSDQFTSDCYVDLYQKSTNTRIGGHFYFTNILSVNGLNAFTANQNSIYQSIPSSCATSYNVNFTSAKYVRTGGSAGNGLDRTSTDVSSYEYTLPSGVTPVSGLTLVSGNTYKGTNNFTIVPKPIGRTTIETRAINDGQCALGPFMKGSVSYIYLDPPTLSISGPSTIRCGETDTKTFTINNGISGGCLTYTWQVANKGWKDASGVPITSNVVTTSPSLQLISGDNNSTPPQSFSVVVTSGSESVTLNKVITYLAPSISIPIYAGEIGFICSDALVTATLVNPPVNSYNLEWSTVYGFEINSGVSPQSTGTDPQAIISKVGSASADELRVSLQATCGIIQSNAWAFEGCKPWSVTLDYANYPIHPEPLVVNCSSTDYIDDWLVNYEWYLETGGGYTLLGTTNNLNLSTYGWLCDPKSLYIRARGYYGASSLKYLTDVNGFCSARMLSVPKKDMFKVYPNPTVDDIIVDYSSVNGSYTIRVADLQGNLQMQQLVKVNSKLINNKINISKLKKGKYIIVIQDGKKTYSKIIEKI